MSNEQKPPEVCPKCGSLAVSDHPLTRLYCCESRSWVSQVDSAIMYSQSYRCKLTCAERQIESLQRKLGEIEAIVNGPLNLADSINDIRILINKE